MSKLYQHRTPGGFLESKNFGKRRKNAALSGHQPPDICSIVMDRVPRAKSSAHHDMAQSESETIGSKKRESGVKSDYQGIGSSKKASEVHRTCLPVF